MKRLFWPWSENGFYFPPSTFLFAKFALDRLGLQSEPESQKVKKKKLGCEKMCLSYVNAKFKHIESTEIIKSKEEN